MEQNGDIFWLMMCQRDGPAITMNKGSAKQTMGVFNYRAQVIEAAETHHIRYEEIPPEKMNQIRDRVLKKFVAPEGRNKLFFWEYMLPPRVSVHNEEGWRWMGEFVSNSNVILFFEKDEEDYGFQFFSGPDLVQILGEMTGGEIYLTDPEISYLLVHNHYDFLLSSGEAVSEWLSKYKTPEYDWQSREDE